MKQSLIIFAALFVTQGALAACPELAGNYKKKDDNSSVQVVSESIQEGAKVYSFGEGSGPMVTDGVARTLGQGVSVTAKCGDNTIIVKIVIPNGQVVNGLIVKTSTGYKSSSDNPALAGPDSEWIKQ